MRQITHVILHHSATDATLRHDDPEGGGLWRAIERNHQKHWAGVVPGYVCDYHFGVGPTGVIFAGQPLGMIAFNCGNARLNAVSIAVCFLGNFQVIRMPASQERGGLALLQMLVARWDIPVQRVMLHREVPDEKTGRPGFTACPGRWFPGAALRETLREPSGGGSTHVLMTR